MLLAVDTETFPIRAGELAPALVCVQLATSDHTTILNKDDGASEIEFALLYGDSLVFHNAPYDLAVLARHRPTLLPAIFAALDAGRIKDTEVREKLLQIADGTLKFDEDDDGNPVKVGYSLADLFSRYYPEKLSDPAIQGWISEKDAPDSWRLRYHELDGKPVGEWPYAAKRYAWLDAVITRAVYLAQSRRNGGSQVVNEDEQVRASFALHLISCHGMTTDAAYVEKLRAKLDLEYDRLQTALIKDGMITAPRAKKSGKNKGQPTKAKRNLKELRELVAQVYADLGKPVPYAYDKKTRKPSKNVAYTREVLESTKHPTLVAFADLGAVEKVRNTYLPVLEQGTTAPINCRYNVLAASGRTSCYSPNLQNIPRKGGVRDAFIARLGTVLAFCDYKAIEAACLAQCNIWIQGFSDMADAINGGMDLHYMVAALDTLNIPYEEAVRLGEAGDETVKEARQGAKAENYGWPGALGPKSFVDYARKTYGVLFTEEEAADRKGRWLKRFREMPGFFEYVKKQTKYTKKITQFVSNRVRGGLGFCDAANTLFQGLAADGIKLALWNVSKACYLDESSPLYGSRPVAMIHDEIIAELPEDKAHEAAEELSRLMREAMRVYVPDVKIETSLALARYWAKDAKETRDSSGRLVCWTPKEKESAGNGEEGRRGAVGRGRVEAHGRREEHHGADSGAVAAA